MSSGSTNPADTASTNHPPTSKMWDASRATDAAAPTFHPTSCRRMARSKTTRAFVRLVTIPRIRSVLTTRLSGLKFRTSRSHSLRMRSAPRCSVTTPSRETCCPRTPTTWARPRARAATRASSKLGLKARTTELWKPWLPRASKTTRLASNVTPPGWGEGAASPRTVRAKTPPTLTSLRWAANRVMARAAITLRRVQRSLERS